MQIVGYWNHANLLNKDCLISLSMKLLKYQLQNYNAERWWDSSGDKHCDKCTHCVKKLIHQYSYDKYHTLLYCYTVALKPWNCFSSEEVTVNHFNIQSPVTMLSITTPSREDQRFASAETNHTYWLTCKYCMTMQLVVSVEHLGIWSIVSSCCVSTD